MNDQQQMVNFVTEEIKKCLSSHIGKTIGTTDEDTINKIKNSIVSYLKKVMDQMNYCNLPVVKVESEGSFVTVNFFDHEGNRLETLGDMLFFMQGDCGIIRQGK